MEEEEDVSHLADSTVQRPAGQLPPRAHSRPRNDLPPLQRFKANTAPRSEVKSHLHEVTEAGDLCESR